jgi:hypothetical protein
MPNLEVEMNAPQEAFDRAMAGLDQAIAEMETEVQSAEDSLDPTLFLPSEPCTYCQIPCLT